MPAQHRDTIGLGCFRLTAVEKEMTETIMRMAQLIGTPVAQRHVRKGQSAARLLPHPVALLATQAHHRSHPPA